jgi:predicted metal-dependent enzyme (double-stranded beta helix superfamily)
MTTPDAVEDLVAALRELGGTPPPVRIAAMLRDMRVDERSLAPYMHWKPQRYTRNLIAREEAFELIAICWDDGVVSAIHDHADSNCTFVVAQGAMRCENFRVRWPDGERDRNCRLEPAGQRILRPGQLDVASGHISVHRVGAVEGRSVTLHVYAKPIEACLHFDEDGNARLTASRYDTLPA